MIELETKVAYQEDMIEQLNNVIIEQQQSIDRLSARLDQMVKHLEAEENAEVNDLSDEIPPHY